MYILYKFSEELNSRGGTMSGYMCFTPYFCLMIGIRFFFLKSERQLICCIFSQSTSCGLDIQFFMFFLWIISSSPKKKILFFESKKALSVCFFPAFFVTGRSLPWMQNGFARMGECHLFGRLPSV